MKIAAFWAAFGVTMWTTSLEVPAQQQDVNAASSPAPAGLPASTSIAPAIGQLRLIGTVKAKTQFCSALEAGAASAARSSIAYEALLYRTALDFASVNLNDALHKQTSMNVLDQDVRTLGILATTGRNDLEALRHTEGFAPAGGAKAAVAVRDAMDGAKARQYELAKELAGILSRIEGERLYTTIDLPVDNVPGALEVLDPSFFGTRQDRVLGDATHALVANLPGNDGIVHDLKAAGTDAEAALKAGNC